MSVTSLQFDRDRELYLDQIEKLVRSHALRKAESLCKLLRYLADHALARPGVALKEYQIATEVFGRPRDFDPQADSAIRVQAGRLRFKLVDYYSHEGLSDSIVVEMPNGAYTLNFHHRDTQRPIVLPAPRSSRYSPLWQARAQKDGSPRLWFYLWSLWQRLPPWQGFPGNSILRGKRAGVNWRLLPLCAPSGVNLPRARRHLG
ncbi:MAG TPA: hypothetical protein VIW68_03290 [Candidatus Sulfotelmatobacter sp.]